MNKSKIEWVKGSNGEPGYTWNPVTGCLNGCEYCYARRITERFGLNFAPKLGDPGMEGACKYDSSEGMDTMLELEKPYARDGRIQPYPMAFLPTFHRYRLDEPQKLKKQSKIFVSSMGDLFGKWVPDEWIEEVFKACEVAPQHTFLFLTKNPSRYMDLYCNGIEFPQNIMLGATITKESELGRQCWIPVGFKSFVSIEPLMEPITGNLFTDWVIVGEMTGPGAVKPEPEWVQSIIDQCRAAGVPVFVKSPLYEKFPIQEWLEGM